MSDDEILQLVSSSIQNAFLSNRIAGPGITWDSLAINNEQSLHIANAVLGALQERGFEIRKRR